LPPVRSGIADYSADLLPALAQASGDLRILRLAGQPVSDEMEEQWHPVPAEESLRSAAGERLPLYQMGNNIHHEEVGRLARELPGVLTLHDLVLHHLAAEETLARGVLEPYLERLTADHGALGAAVATARRWGYYSDASLFAFPAHRSLLRAQRGVLVHSRWAVGVIEEEDPEIAVRAVPMGVPLPPAADRGAGLALRKRYGLPEDKPVLGSFGFQTPIKRTERVVEALAQPGLEEVHLVIAGQVSGHCDLEGIARRGGVWDRVHVLGFVPFEDFEAAIAATDLCLNLRYPTAGETSASLLRVLAVGRPAVVSDYAQFAELPDDVVVKAPLGDDEVLALAASLRDLLAHPEALQAMGERARKHVAHTHAPERSAAAVVEACRELAEISPPGSSPASASSTAEKVSVPAPSSLTWSQLKGTLSVAGDEAPWPEGARRSLSLKLTNSSPARWLAGTLGPGAVALQVQLLELDDEGEPIQDLYAHRPWLPLPRTLGPGESESLSLEVRKPLGRSRLRIEPHVLGGAGFSKHGGPVWQKEWNP